MIIFYTLVGIICICIPFYVSYFTMKAVGSQFEVKNGAHELTSVLVYIATLAFTFAFEIQTLLWIGILPETTFH